MFFEHLDKTITNNIISLQLEEAHMKDVVSCTEVSLATAQVPTDVMADIYQKFIDDNEIQDHQLEPAFRAVLKSIQVFKFFNQHDMSSQRSEVSQESPKRKRRPKNKVQKH